MKGNTPFTEIYDCFLGKITDDMYLEWTKEDTLKDLQSILLNALPNFEFPRFSLYDYSLKETKEEQEEYGAVEGAFFKSSLTSEEINILATLMLNVWVQRQLTSIENIRMKYSGSDFKMTSQANHLSKLIALKKEVERQERHLQRLYHRRRINENGEVFSNWSSLIEKRVINDEYEV